MTTPHTASGRRRLIGLVALPTAAVALLAGCATASKPGQVVTVTASQSPVASTSASHTAAASSTVPVGKPVHVSLNIADGSDVGVGMPIIATFDRKITSGVAFQAATKVTVNGTPARGAWYFEFSDPASGHVMEAHFRLQQFWPAHAQIHLDLPVKGQSAGNGLYFRDSLTSDFQTHAANVGTVDASTHMLTITSDGKAWGSFPVSMGANDTRTRRGTKVIMERLPTVCMHDIAGTYYECGIINDLRLTYDGEYLHSAPWNVYNVDHGIDSSNGCTNLLPSDAVKVYGFMRIGDPVMYPNANGARMQLGDGYGDWNLTWSQWQTGGAVATI